MSYSYNKRRKYLKKLKKDKKAAGAYKFINDMIKLGDKITGK